MATKGGRGPPGDGSWTVNATPEHLKRAAERRGADAIGLYRVHKPDPAVPWAESVGALRELLDAGTIRAAGRTRLRTEPVLPHRPRQRARAAAEHPAGPGPSALEPPGGIRRSSLDGPSAPASASTAFHRIADDRGVSPQQVALTWLLARSPAVIPVPGAGRPAS